MTTALLPRKTRRISVDAYMARLLKSYPGAAAATTVPAPSENSASAPTACSPNDGALRELVPRAPAAEKNVDLEALRELANLSAQTAIDRHARRELISQSTRELTLALVSATVCAVLATIWWFFNASDLLLYPTVAFVAAAMLWSFQYAVLTGRMLVRRVAGSSGRRLPASRGVSASAEGKAAEKPLTTANSE